MAEKDTITINLYSKASHCAQVLTGFLMLEEQIPIHLRINNKIDADVPHGIALVEVIWDNNRIIYDMNDGYQSIQDTKFWLSRCDYYFKRSYSAQKNDEYFTDDEKKKIMPLGMNYFVTCHNNPYNINGVNGTMTTRLKEWIKLFWGRKRNAYFTCDRIEAGFHETPINPTIMFCTRLWNKPSEELILTNPLYYAHENKWIDQLNETRINTIRALKKQYGERFIGGLQNTSLARALAPDLILSNSFTERSNYLKTMHKADICIGTLGLHESTGWKTGEYVASGMAIVHEEFVYTVPGNFIVSENYLPFNNDNELLKQVAYLANNPTLIDTMKQKNIQYYNDYLKPDSMIKNTLKMVSAKK